MITVRQVDSGDDFTMHAPRLINNVTYTKVERTICITPTTTNDYITVVVSLLSSYPITFDLTLYEMTHFSTGLNSVEPVAGVGPTTPDYRFVNLLGVDEDSLLQVKVRSEEDVCALVSVQPTNCPVSDTEVNIEREGAFQSMLEIASFVFDRKGGHDGVFVVFVVTENEAVCRRKSGEGGAANRTKNFTFEISDNLSKQKILWEVVLGFVLLGCICILTLIATGIYSVYSTKNVDKKLEKIREKMEKAQKWRKEHGYRPVNNNCHQMNTGCFTKTFFPNTVVF